jgi:hypothetical protein
MGDTRRMGQKRQETLTVKLLPEELDRLTAYAAANFRSPAGQVRFWIDQLTPPLPSTKE